MASGKVAIPTVVGGPSELGVVATGADGLASITFTKSYATKPKVALSPEYPLATEVVTVQIDSWDTDAAGNYIGMTVATGNDAGKPEAGVTVHYALWQ